MTTFPPALNGTTLNRYHLQVKGSDTPLDVESFTAREALSECYRYDILLTSISQDIDPSSMLMKDVTFIMQTLPETTLQATIQPEIQRSIHGVITHFSRVSSSRDEATYALTLRPRFTLLDKSRRTAIYQNLSVTEVAEQILRKNHNWAGWLFDFRTRKSYPKRELITQFMQSDFEFISCLLSEVGIGFRFEMDPEIKHEVVIFTDSGRDWHQGISVPVVNPAGMFDGRVESLWNLQTHHQVVERSASHRDYNYRNAGQPLDTEADITHDDDKSTYGNDYQYAEGYQASGEKYAGQNAESESGQFYSILRHERALNNQHLLSLESNATIIAPGQILEPEGNVPSAFHDGMLITAITSQASRSSHYKLHAEGMAWRDNLNWRPALQPRPRITVPLPARVTSLTSNDIYSHIDKHGRYRVKFHFDQVDWKAGYESPWLRLARPYAGDTYGLHLPLLAGTEVSVMFDGGHPDKPFIAFTLHDSLHPDLVTVENFKRNILRSPAQNELRLQDERQKENIHLSTPHSGKSQLNLGFNVMDEDPKELRGEGAELRTDGHGVLRAAKGVFITADAQPQAQGKLLDMDSAIRELEAASQEASSLRHAAELAKAELADIQKQTDLLNDTLKNLQQQALLLSAPAGIAQVTPASLQLAAGQNLIATSGQDADFSIGKALRVAVGSTLSLFAKMAGIKLYAAAGKVDIQAQSDALNLLALRDMQISSQEGKVVISAKTELLLESGGAWVQLKDGNITLGGSGNVSVKCGTLEKLGPASQQGSITLPQHCASMVTDAAAGKDASVSL